jgi:nucleotide-binding universal stress UspA family protein
VAISRILIATDFSACARNALEYALTLASKQGAHVTLLHAWSPPIITGPVESPPLVQLPGRPGQSLSDYVHEEAARELRGLVDELTRRGYADVHAQLLLGDPRHVIVNASADHDLVVMGTHGRGGLARLVLGSVADFVVRHARCPVLTVHPSHAEAG